MTKPKEIKKARGIVQIRQELTPDDCTNTRGLLQMFQRICKSNPDAIRAAFGPYLTRDLADNPEKTQRMIDFYCDRAEYLAELFDYR